MTVIGIMQGRLSPPQGGRIQSFPAGSWEEEFPRAREAGLDCIEWIYEEETEGLNPLATDDGIRTIHRCARATSVGVFSVCADYYMADFLIGTGGAVREAARRHLAWLLGRARALGARYIVLPFVDSSSLRAGGRMPGLRPLLEEVLPEAERQGVEVHLETDLLPVDLRMVLAEADHPLLRANYDIGNSASLGYDPGEELGLLGEYIGSVHVKDRLMGGETVPLGTGAADFPRVFRLLADAGYGGSYILQAAREPGLGEVALAARNRSFVLGLLAALRD